MTDVEHWDEATDGQLSEDAMTRKLESRGYAVQRYTYAPGTYFPDHAHDVDKVDAVLSGRFRMTMGDAEIILEAGDCLAVPRDVVHSAEVVGDEPVVSLDAIRSEDGTQDDEALLLEPGPVVGPADRSLAEAVRGVALDINDKAQEMASSKDAFGAESVHEIRVSSKRLRALWQLVRPVIQPQIARAANERLRDMARALANARDTEVLSGLLADLRECEEPLYHSAFDRAGAMLPAAPDFEDGADELRAAMLETLDADRDEWRSMVLPDNDSLIDHGLGRSYRKTRRRAETASRTASHEDSHRLRRWVKYMRYQLEALSETPGEDLAQRIDTLRTLGTVLGKRNDLALLRGRLIEHSHGDTFGVVFRAIEMRDGALMRQIPEAATHLFFETPENFVAVIRDELEAVASPA